jgi:hypothetical protein
MGARARVDGRTATAVPMANGVDQEALVQAITQRVMAALTK